MLGGSERVLDLGEGRVLGLGAMLGFGVLADRYWRM